MTRSSRVAASTVSATEFGVEVSGIGNVAGAGTDGDGSDEPIVEFTEGCKGVDEFRHPVTTTAPTTTTAAVAASSAVRQRPLRPRGGTAPTTTSELTAAGVRDLCGLADVIASS